MPGLAYPRACLPLGWESELDSVPPRPVWAALDQHCVPEPAACLGTLLKGAPTLKDAGSPGSCYASGDTGYTLNPTDCPATLTAPCPQ